MNDNDRRLRRGFGIVFGIWAAVALAWSGAEARAQEPQGLALQEITHLPLQGRQVQIRLAFSGPAPTPASFTIDNPPRIAIDLPDTQLGDIPRVVQLGSGVVRNIRSVQSGGRTRLVIALTEMVPYALRSEGNLLLIDIPVGAAAQPQVARAGERREAGTAGGRLTNVDFKRVEEGAGRITVTLSRPNTVVDLSVRGNRLIAEFFDSSAPEALERRLDVRDFATPVATIDTFNRDGAVQMVITPEGEFDHLAYQIGNTYTVDVKPVSKAEKEAAAAAKGQYTGERLSLNFQNIDVRAVLQLLGDFTGLNIVASDTVQGNVTLRLKNVPWDQALDIILKAKGLGMRRNGDVVMIAPSDEIAAREKLELEARQQIEELAPLRTEFFQINYAKAGEIAELLKAEKNSLLSKRGNVTIDGRTNTLMILDTPDKLDEIRLVISRLDVPVRQVLIESRIVIANDDFSRNIGARFGVTNAAKYGNSGMVATTGSALGTNTMVNSGVSNIQSTGQPFPVATPQLNDRLNVNLPLLNPAGQIALAVLGSDYIVDLELSAMQAEGRGEVVSSPRVVTANQKAAQIEQGVEIPYLQATSSGATSVAFKKAVLSLNVTPQITPDDRVIMDLTVNKDSVGQIFAGVPSIDTREVNTQVLVNNGDTVVLGGIYEQTRSDQVDKVPLLGDIPLLGALFRQTRKVDDKAELLIFVTPKILKEGLKAQLN